MGTSTATMQFYKPAGTEFVDEALDLNDNWDRAEAGFVADRARLALLEAKGFTYISVAQTVTNSATKVNMTNGSFAVQANSVYVAEYHLRVSGDSASHDISYDFTFPANADCSFHVMAPNSAATATGFASEHVHRFDSSSPTASTPAGVLATSTMHKIRVVCKTGATAGTVALRFAQNVATAAEGVTINASSTVEWRKMS